MKEVVNTGLTPSMLSYVSSFTPAEHVKSIFSVQIPPVPKGSNLPTVRPLLPGKRDKRSLQDVGTF